MQYLVILLQAVTLAGMCRVIHCAVTARIAAEEASASAEESIAHAQAAAGNSAQVAIAISQMGDDEAPKKRHL